jgi:hypothetical protein
MPATKTRPGLTGVVPLGWEPSDEELSQAIEETIEAEKILDKDGKIVPVVFLVNEI